ncbi:MAG TPA: hypothetical protein GX720_03405 [Clostridiaceae bacterium]|nr:hypothetical protein [Clostridiaceae bacterium]
MDEKVKELKSCIGSRIGREGDPDRMIPALWEALTQIAQDEEQKRPPLTKITAGQVRLLVTDDETGRVFERTLPLDYLETSNGITLSGETYAAQPAQIVFYTEFALGKLLELQGEDDDHDHDHDHDHHHHHHD